MSGISFLCRKLYRATIWKWLPREIRNQRNVSGYDSETAQKVLMVDNYIRTHLSEYEDNSTIRYIRKYGISDLFNDYFVNKYIASRLPKVFRDEKNKLFYVIHNSHRMYFPTSFETEEDVGIYYQNILMEQDPESPHFYGRNDFIGENTVLIDAGTAEGFFSLDYVEKAKKIIMIECDPKWVNVLRETFSAYKEKIVVIDKFLSDHDDDRSITIDTVLRQYAMDDEDIFIKMDLEGCEYETIKGAQSCRNRRGKVNMAITVYHNVEDEAKVRSLLAGYNIQPSNGYMFFAPYLHKYEAPYLTHGLLYVSKN